MKFDNAQFEKGCAESMSTLDKLKKKIDSTSGEGLSNLGTAANKVDLSNLEKSLEAVNKKFSVLGVIGATVISDITKSAINMAKKIVTTIPSIIKEKGWARALNIEDAKFQLEGLGVAWKDISDDISYGVKDTAYGLDAAAKAASQLVASGVEIGDSMKAALRGISGVAAMTNSQYEEISPIFTTVAGQGKLMTMQLRQLESRGLNVAATLGKQLGITEAQVREMVTNGEIDFATFSKAMDNAFGQHAKDANKTFTGVLSNLKASLGRMGAMFYTPVITENGPIVKAMQALKDRLADIESALGPLAERWTQFIAKFGKGAEKIFANMDMTFVTHLVNAAINAFNGLLSIIKPIGQAFKDIFGSNTQSTILTISRAIEKFTAKMKLSADESEDLRATVRGLLSVFDILGTVLKQIIGAITGIDPKVINIRATVLKITGTIGDLITYLAELIKKSNIIKPLIEGIKIAVELLALALLKAIEGIVKLVSWVSKLPATKKILKGIADALYLVVGALVLLVSKIKDIVVAIKSGHLDDLGVLGNVIIFIKDGVLGLVDAISQLGIVQDIIAGITGLFDKFRESADKVFGKNSSMDGVVTIVDEAAPKFGEMSDELKTVNGALVEVGDSTAVANKGLSGVLATVGGFIKSLPLGKIVAVAFAVALAASLLKLVDAMSRFGKGIQKVGGFLTYFQQRGVIGLITGSGQYSRAPNRIIDIAIAVAALAASVYALSKIKTSTLKETVKILGELAVGYVGVLAALAALDKWLGFTGAVDGIGIAMLEVAAAIAVLATAFSILSNSDFDNAKQASIALGGIIVALTTMSIIVSKFGGKFKKVGLSFVSLALSIMVLVKALEMLNNVEGITTDTIADLAVKLGAIGVLGAEMMVLAAICDKLGGKSFMKLATSALMLGIAVKIFLSVLDSIPSDVVTKIKDQITRIVGNFSEIVAKAVEIFKNLAALVLTITGVVLIIGFLTGAIAGIVTGIGKITKHLSKIRKYQDYHKKALNTLATAVLVGAVTASIALLSLVVVALTKAKLNENLDALLAGLAAMATIVAAMSLLIGVMGTYLKSMKGVGAAMVAMVLTMATVVVGTVGIATWVYSVLAQEGDWKSKATEFAIAGGSLAVILGTMYILCSALGKLKGISFNKSTSAAIIAVIAGIGLVAAAVVVLSHTIGTEGLGKEVAISLGIMVGVMASLLGLVFLMSKITQTGFKPSTAKVILAMTAAIAVVAGSLFVLTKYAGSWDQMLAAMISMAGVMAVATLMMYELGEVKFNKTQQRAFNDMIIAIVTIAGTLFLLGKFGDWFPILTAAVSMSIVMGVFAGMTRILGEGTYKKDIWNAFAGIAATALVIAGTLMILAKSMTDADSVLNAALAMSEVMAVFSIMTFFLSQVTYKADIWLAFSGIVATVLAIGNSLSMVAKYDWGNILAAALSISAVMIVFSVMAIALASIPDALTGMIAMVGVAAAALIVGGSLALVAKYDWPNILVAALGIIAVMGVFALIAAVAGNMPTVLVGMVTMIGIAAAAVLIGLSLGMVAKYDWINILAAAGALVATMGLFAVAATILGAVAPLATIGAGVLILIGVATIPFAAGILIAAHAMEVFASALTIALPPILTFISGVVTYGTQLITAAGGLVALAAGMMAIGAACVVLTAGVVGLMALALALPLIVSGLSGLASIDLATLNTNAANFVTVAINMAAAGILMAAGAPGVIAMGAAVNKLAANMVSAATAMSLGIETKMAALPKKMVEVGVWVGKSLATGMLAAASVKMAINAAQTLATNVEETIRNALGIHSYSELFGGIGEWIPTSIGIGVDNKSDKATKSTSNMLDSIMGAFDGFDDDMADAGASGLDAFILEMSDPTKWGALGQLLKDKINAIANGVRAKYQGTTTSDSTKKAIAENGDAFGNMGGLEDFIDTTHVADEAVEDFDFDLSALNSTLGGTGSGASSAASKITDLSDAFKKVEKGTKVSLEIMNNNLVENYKETVLWARDMKILMGKGYDDAIVQYIKNMGVAGHETVKAFMNASADEVPILNANLKRYLSVDEDAQKYILGNYEAFGGQIVEVMTGAIASFSTELAETIQNAIDPFGKFNDEVDMSGTEMLANMNSQLTGIRKWSDNLITLMDRGVSQGIIDKFYELGPSCYAEVAAMTQMTDAQLAEANEVWAAQMGLGVEIAKVQAAKYQEVGYDLYTGFINGIDMNAANQAGMQMGDQAIDGTKTALDSHSPSRVYAQIGRDVIDGLANWGIMKNSQIVYRTLYDMGRECIRVTSELLNEQAGMQIGEHLMSGLARGIRNGESGVANAIASVAARAISEARSRFDINSPSKVFRSIGLSIDEGLAQGIDWGVGDVTSSISDMSDSAINQMATVVQQIAEGLQDEFDGFNPVITPQLDLTEIQNGKSRMSALLGMTTSAQLANSISSNMSAGKESVNSGTPVPATQNIIFNQTNNSPKALDRYEIYRQTRNQLSQIKGALS